MSNAIQLFRQFRSELDQRADKIAALLPPTISRERFLHYARIAVSNQPRLLLCHRVSLHNAIMKAATDRLVPDGREGVIIPREEKGGLLTATWQPMAHGIRKRAAEHGIIIDAKVVCAKDKFEWEEGLNPVLRHVPTPLDADPGDMIGAYAVFRREGRVLHFEVMRKGQILAVKAISKQQNGLMWSKFEDQAWIKTVVRRASKSVPEMPELVQQVIERHDDDFALPRGEEPLPQAAGAEEAARDPLSDPQGTPPVDGEAMPAGEGFGEIIDAEAEPSEAAGAVGDGADPRLEAASARNGAAGTPHAVVARTLHARAGSRRQA